MDVLFADLPAVEGRILAGRYRVLRSLGQGLMSRAYLADDRGAPGQRVVVKLLPPMAAADPALRALLAQAVQAQRVLKHPNVARLLAFEQDDQASFLVVEHIDGESLQELLPELAPLDEEQVAGVLLPVADALDVIHAQGLVHGDLRPSNILVDQDGKPWLTDVAVSRLVIQHFKAADPALVQAALPYMSPEQIQGKRPQPTQDIYSLAATIYACLADRLPFDPLEGEQAILNHPPAPPTDAETPLRQAVMAALAKTPAQRPDNCRALVAPGTHPRLSERPAYVPEASDESATIILPAMPDAGETGEAGAVVDPEPLMSILDSAAGGSDTDAQMLAPARGKPSSAMPWILAAGVLVACLVGMIVGLVMVVTGGQDPLPTEGVVMAAAGPETGPEHRGTSRGHGERTRENRPLRPTRPTEPAEYVPPQITFELAEAPSIPLMKPEVRETDLPVQTHGAPDLASGDDPDRQAAEPALPGISNLPTPEATDQSPAQEGYVELRRVLELPFAMIATRSQVAELGQPVAGHFDATMGAWTDLPEPLASLYFTPTLYREGVRQFRVVRDGVVLMAVYQKDWGDVSEPGGGWRQEVIGRFDLEQRGWEPVGEFGGGQWLLVYREVKRGERFKIRTKRFITPMLITPEKDLILAFD